MVGQNNIVLGILRLNPSFGRYPCIAVDCRISLCLKERYTAPVEYRRLGSKIFLYAWRVSDNVSWDVVILVVHFYVCLFLNMNSSIFDPCGLTYTPIVCMDVCTFSLFIVCF